MASPQRGPLHGVPIGLKDTIDTFDMPTEMGSPIYRGNQPRADAACVALLRRAGAVILGKTATCEFAGSAPPETTNPHNACAYARRFVERLGGGVADHMVPAALGTQTGGSVLRPSSFCGIFGYKPTYNTINKIGVWPAADSIDTIGWLARSIDDMEMLTAVLRMQTPKPPRKLGGCAAHRRLAHRFVGCRATGNKKRRRRRRAKNSATPAHRARHRHAGCIQRLACQ